MNGIVILSPVIAIALIVLYFTNNERFKGLAVLLSFMLAGFWFTSITDDTGDGIVYLGLALLLSTGLISMLDLTSKKWLRMIFAPVVALAILLIANGKTIELNGMPTLAVNKFVVMGLVVAAFAYSAVHIKKYIINKLNWKSPELQQTVELIFSGLSLYLGYFGASILGVFLVGIVLMVGSMMTDRSTKLGSFLSALLLLSIVDTGFSVSQSDSILGLFLGFALGVLSDKVGTMEGNRSMWSGFTLLMGLVFGYSLGYAGEMHPNMGGVDAILAFMIALGIRSIFIDGISGYALGSSLMYAVIPFTFMFTPVVEGDDNTPTDMLKIENSATKLDVSYMKLNGELSGKHSIIADSSRVDFFLGAEGETKGAFKKVAGNISFGSTPEENSCEITLDMKDFTTFNKFRDESLVGDEYFKVDKYPTMSYKAKKAVVVDAETVKFMGDFTMLGKTKQVEVTFKRLDTQNGSIILVGEGKIDRTMFGMTPSITEGNIVTFNYRVQVQK